MTDDALRTLIAVMPERPGCYEYFDAEGNIIYVGKAKNLKRRVSSYFSKEHDSNRTRLLVRQIRDIKYIVVDTEGDALLLENSLIKQHQPRYNVLLKDDKTYPSIVIKNEPFPRVMCTRLLVRDGSQYYGPYPSAHSAKLILQMLQEIYPLRSCKYPLTAENIHAKRYKVCLQYHIKRCKGCCEGRQSAEEYMQNVNEVRDILKGNISRLCRQLYDQMQQLAEEWRFEEAQAVKTRYAVIENYRAKSAVVPPSLNNVDVFSIADDDRSVHINYLHIGDGAVVQAYTFEYRKRLDEPLSELLALGIVEMRSRFRSTAHEVIVPFLPDTELPGVTFLVPQRGDRKKLLNLSEMNVRQHKAQRLLQAEKMNPEQRQTRLLREIQDALQLSKLPARIECFDNSNIQGSDPVAACVVFLMGKPAKQAYRKYTIRTVEGPDDYASMREVVFRRYSRAIAESSPLPDLIITDGGKGQMEVVRNVIRDELHLDIPIAGLSKDRRHHTSDFLFGDPPESIGISRKSPLFLLLERMQDEVHRFAIAFHRDKRSKRQLASELDGLKGIGEKTKTLLLQRYKSVKRIRAAGFAELKALVGEAKAKILLEKDS
ncbi:MAG: excinuclease ABC subunit UvrC [Tannerellaceae bacterium]|jgi:excinuclease ABC subunit C|nr:excinuclease ABC subunit UvrC [Tannerellaceae bacterium]